VPYDDREKYSKGSLNSRDTPSSGVGLLLMCFQSNIGNQFEYLQKAIFSKTQAGGTRYPWEQPTDPAWPIEWGKPDMKTVNIDLNRVITLKGGEYFFAPSLSFLKNL
jgi:deferrochelatase/peroxidase EfeB